MRADIVAGAVVSDYELTKYTKERRKRSELKGRDPVILVWPAATSAPRTTSST